MSDYIKAQKEFEKYLEQYDENIGEMRLKKIHTYEVVNLSEYIASSLNLSDEEVNIAKIIALLHDIGRFYQRKVSESWDDKKIDHAEYGVEILFNKGLIRKFIQTDEFDSIIYKAILNHNKLKIEKNLSKRELLYCKIIRDADKIDNFRVKVEENMENIFKYNPETINYEDISEKVYNDFMKAKCININDRVTQIDYYVTIIAFIFDLNFEISLKYIQEKNYIDKIIDRIEYKNLDTKKKMEEIRKFAKEYIEK